MKLSEPLFIAIHRNQIWYAGSDNSPQHGFHCVMACGVSKIQCILALTVFQNRISPCFQ